MKKEIKIILEQNIHKSKNGEVFEDLIRIILERQQYNITQRIHVTGLEIDLFAKHNLKNEILYAECKAKEKPKSTEIKNFIFSLDYGIEGQKADYGYFIHTEELDQQAAGLQLQIESSKLNVTFIGPDKILRLLEDHHLISPFVFEKIGDYLISKLTLAITYFGYYFIAILQEGSVPKYYSVFDQNCKPIKAIESLPDLSSSIKDIQDLEFISISSIENVKVISNLINDKDTITEIRESENWFDYTPASVKHFIGRISIRREIKSFIESVRTNRTNNRIFFIDGKSGWGKSSIIAELKGSSRTKKYWRSRMYVLAIDTRSANTANFVGIAFKKLLEGAIEKGFIKSNIFSKEISIISPFNVLDDSSVKEILSELKRKKKVLVLVFDQFEDKFKNENLFEAFYQFCLDVNDKKENLVVGFSWKSETSIPFGNPSYFKFNQLKDYSNCITVPEFSQKDAKQVVGQLEKTIKLKIGNDLERRLIISSQGYPWLIKKLCIHTLNQYNSGKTIEELLEEELNYKDLFEKDLLDLDSEQAKMLTHIAKKAYEGNPFDISETNLETQTLIDQLIHKRLVIRTGTTYNIYWDIFRDYIVTGEIPVLGESYLIRASGNTCLDTFLVFKNNNTLTLDQIVENSKKSISEKALLNILLELRSIGLIRKLEGENSFETTEKVTSVSKEFFEEYITKKLQNYTPYLELLRLNKSSVTIEDLKTILKSIFKTEHFEEKTWYAYAMNLAIWFKISNLSIKEKLVEIKKGRLSNLDNKYDQTPYYSPSALLNIYKNASNGRELSGKGFHDLLLMGLIDENEKIIKVSLNLGKYLMEESLKFSKINEAFQCILENPTLTQQQLLSKKPELVSHLKSTVSKRQIMSIIYSWAKFCIILNEGQEYNFQITKRKSSKYYLRFGPKHFISTMTELKNGTLDLNNNNKRKLQDIEYFGFISLNDKTYKLTDIGENLLKIKNKEEYISSIAFQNENIKRFLKYCDSPTTLIKHHRIIEDEKDFFSGLKASSIKAKCSIYLSWAKYIKINSTLN